jgi:hypothetical protein
MLGRRRRRESAVPGQAGLLLRCRSKSKYPVRVPEQKDNWASKSLFSYSLADSFAVDYRSRKRIQI